MALSFKQRALLRLGPLPASLILGSLAWSWRHREFNGESVSPRRCGSERYIYVYWHEYILPTVGAYRGLPIHALASHSFDGDLISALMGRLGFPPPARGSSSRGGASAVMEMKSMLEAGNHVALTVDGPRGPRRRAQAGAVKLAQISGRSIVPVGSACALGLRLRSWDKTCIPLPFSRVHTFLGGPIKVGEGEAELEAGHLRMQEGLDQVTRLADESLEEGT